jgi:flagellar hook protein FlgE
MEIGRTGIYQATQKLGSSAGKIAANKGDLSENMVGMMGAENQLKASSKIIQAKDEMLGTVIDLKA